MPYISNPDQRQRSSPQKQVEVTDIVDMPEESYRPRAGDKVPMQAKPPVEADLADTTVPEGDIFPQVDDRALNDRKEQLAEELIHLRTHVSHTTASALDTLHRTYEWAHGERRKALAKAVPDLVKNAGLAGEKSYALPHPNYAIACALCAFEDEDKQWWVEQVLAQVTKPEAVDVERIPTGAQFSKWDREQLHERIQEVSHEIDRISGTLVWREAKRRNLATSAELSKLEAGLGIGPEPDAQPSATYGGLDDATT